MIRTKGTIARLKDKAIQRKTKSMKKTMVADLFFRTSSDEADVTADTAPVPSDELPV